LEVRLKPWESRRLAQLRDHAASARTFKRAVCLLLSASGERAAVIARVTGLSADAVSDIRRRWRQRGLRSLDDRPRAGRPTRVTNEYRRELGRALRKGPLACGLVFTVWSIARLSAYLKRRTGITLGVNRLRQLAHQEGFVVARPKHTLQGKRDQRQYRRTRQQLEQLKKGPAKRTHLSNCGTLMPRNSISCRTWFAAGNPRGGNGR
jgi:transposase